MVQVLMVCTGNICRSAMAEVVFRDLVAANAADTAGLLTDGETAAGLPTAAAAKLITVDSCGVSAEEAGNPIDYRAAQVLQENGYRDFADHVARQIEVADLRNNRLVLAMTYRHYSLLQQFFAQAVRRGDITAEQLPELRMLREFEPEAYRLGLSTRPLAARNEVPDVTDPWYGDIPDFRSCLAIIERCLPNVLTYLGAE